MFVLEWTPRALLDLERLEDFLYVNSPRAAAEAVDGLLAAAADLREFPQIGRPLSEDHHEYRELPVLFSNSGYVILYRFDGHIVEVQAIKHMREAGY
jgi:plasmid stabilization system protein ParE